jgi:hypothetical protein
LEVVVVLVGVFLAGFWTSYVGVLVVGDFCDNFVIISNNFVIFVFLCLK